MFRLISVIHSRLFIAYRLIPTMAGDHKGAYFCIDTNRSILWADLMTQCDIEITLVTNTFDASIIVNKGSYLDNNKLYVNHVDNNQRVQEIYSCSTWCVKMSQIIKDVTMSKQQ